MFAKLRNARYQAIQMPNKIGLVRWTSSCVAKPRNFQFYFPHFARYFATLKILKLLQIFQFFAKFFAVSNQSLLQVCLR